LADAIRAEAGSEVGADFRFQIDGLHEDLTRNARETLILLTCAVAAVFLIACINVAGIATSQYLARQRELALRVSLGAGRLRITWQLLTESVILALTAAAAGIAVAWILAEPLNRLLPAGYLRAGPIRPDWRILVVGVGLAPGVVPIFNPCARRGGKTNLPGNPAFRLAPSWCRNMASPWLRLWSRVCSFALYCPCRTLTPDLRRWVASLSR
jgi:hypothetical protein